MTCYLELDARHVTWNWMTLGFLGSHQGSKTASTSSAGVGSTPVSLREATGKHSRDVINIKMYLNVKYFLIASALIKMIIIITSNLIYMFLV